MSEGIKPDPRVLEAWREARTIEIHRDRALARGDREKARRLTNELEAASDRVDRLIRGQLAEARVMPSESRRGNGVRLKAYIPGACPATGRPGIQSAGKAYATPVWSLALDPSLKYAAATYAAFTEIRSGGRTKGIDPAAIIVDGGGVGLSPQLAITDICRALDRSHAALDGVPGLSALRTGQAGRRQSIPSRRLVDLVTLEDKLLCDVLALHGWARGGDSKPRLLEVLVAGLDAVRCAFTPSVTGTGSTLELYLTPDAAIDRNRWRSADEWHTISA